MNDDIDDDIPTPGPWRWADWDAKYGTMEDPENMTVLERCEIRGDIRRPVIQTRTDPDPVKILGIDDPIREADKRLIANAPDLAAAVHVLLDMFGGNMATSDYTRLRELAGPR